MSEYQDYFFQEHQKEEQFSYLHSPFIAQKTIQDFNFYVPTQDQKCIVPTEAIDESTEIISNSQTIKSKFQHPFSKKKERMIRLIEFQTEQKQKRKIIFRGLKNDTTELNINFKTIFLNHFKQLSKLRQVSVEDRLLIKEFNNTSASFASLKKLCKSNNLKIKGLLMLKRSKIIKQIIKSSCTMQNKLTMIKFVQNLVQNFNSQKLIKWKDKLFP